MAESRECEAGDDSRFPPSMLEEMFYHPAMQESGNPALPLLIAFSMFRDDFPWLYELASQFSRAVDHGNPRTIETNHPEDQARAEFYALLSRLYAAAPDASLLAAIAAADELEIASQDGPAADLARDVARVDRRERRDGR